MENSNENNVSMKQIGNKSNPKQGSIEHELWLEESKFYMTELRGFLPAAELKSWEISYSQLSCKV